MQKNSKDKPTVVDNNLCHPQQPYHKSIIHVTRVHILPQLLLLVLQNFCLALGPPTYDTYIRWYCLPYNSQHAALWYSVCRNCGCINKSVCLLLPFIHKVNIRNNIFGCWLLWWTLNQIRIPTNRLPSVPLLLGPCCLQGPIVHSNMLALRKVIRSHSHPPPTQNKPISGRPKYFVTRWDLHNIPSSFAPGTPVSNIVGLSSSFRGGWFSDCQREFTGDKWAGGGGSIRLNLPTANAITQDCWWVDGCQSTWPTDMSQ